MPPRESDMEEKSPIEGPDLEGLQLDTRAKDNRDPVLDGSKPQAFLDDDFDDHMNYINQKQRIFEDPEKKSRDSHYPLDSNLSPSTLVPPKTTNDIYASPLPPEPVAARICGLRRHRFWEVFGLVLSFIVVAAVVGGVVGGLQANTGPDYSAAPPPNTTNPAKPLPPLSMSDVVSDSPLNIISYDEGGSGTPESRQTFRIYYQTVNGNIEEAVSSGWSSWQTARPIFTDAMNHTGLATVTYLNGSQQQGSIFYVGGNGFVSEKRKIFNSTAYWEPGTLNNLNLPAVGNITLPAGSTDPPNQYDSYRMAAVYSTKFKSGAGIRLYYHAEDLNGTFFVQEVIWTQSKDQWSKGAQIQGAWPNSHFAATIDESTNLLRLFFSGGANALQEMVADITKSPLSYSNGIELPKLLENNCADLAATSHSGTTSVFYYATNENVGIHELMVTGVPDSFTAQESFNVSAPLVARPLQPSSPYQPIAAVNTAVSGLTPQIFAFWTNNVTGDINSTFGYREILQLSRQDSVLNWPTTTPIQVPLGS